MATHSVTHPLTGVRGSFRAPESEFIYFVTDAGKICRVRTTPSGVNLKGTVSLGNSQLSYHLDGDELRFDVRYGKVAQLFDRRNNALIGKIQNPPTGGLEAITPQILAALPITQTQFSEPGNSVTGNFYGVKTTDGNLAAVRIYLDGAITKMDWITYRTSNAAEEVGSGFSNAEDVVIVETDTEIVAYVTGTNGNGEGCIFVATSPKQSKPVFTLNLSIADGLDAPKQMVYERTNNKLLVATVNKIVAVDANYNVDSAVVLIEDIGIVRGIVVNAAGNRVYFSTEDGNAIWGGTLDLVANTIILDGQALTSNLGPVGSLQWADEEESALLISIGDDGSPSANRIMRISLDDPTFPENLLDGITTAGEPRSLEVLSPTKFFLTSSTGLGQLDCGLPIGLDVALGIGFVPFQSIAQSGFTEGLANTMGLNGYFFRVENVPFGGTLHLLINHAKAFQDGYRYFQVRFIQNGVASQIMDSFGDLKWYSALSRFVVMPTVPTTVGSRTGAYPIRAPGDLWYNPHLGARLNTRNVPNGLNTLEITFLDENGNVKGTFAKKIYIENLDCRVKFVSFLVNGQPLNQRCGVWQYTSKDNPVQLQFEVNYLGGVAFSRYGLSIRVGSLTVHSEAGPYNPGMTLFTISFAKLRDLMGKCNIATLTATMSVSQLVTNGYYYIGSSRADASFSLVPPNTNTGGFQIDEP